jgi:AcrR family transcriptional regulator
MGIQERRARQKEGIREEILDAARALFVKEGYENVSIRKIAEKIEYSPGTIYLHFRDKAEILEQICEETFVRLERKLSAINHDTAGNAMDRLRRGLRVYIQFGLDNPHHYIITFMMSGHQPKPGDFLTATAGGRCFGELIKGVTAAMQAGMIEPGDVAEISQAIWAGIHGVTSLLITACGFPFIEQNRLIDRVIDVLIRGVAKA